MKMAVYWCSINRRYIKENMKKLSINPDSTSCLAEKISIHRAKKTIHIILSNIQSNATELIFYTLMSKNKVDSLLQIWKQKFYVLSEVTVERHASVVEANNFTAQC
jgi:hypothetical protein